MRVKKDEHIGFGQCCPLLSSTNNSASAAYAYNSNDWQHLQIVVQLLL